MATLKMEYRTERTPANLTLRLSYKQNGDYKKQRAITKVKIPLAFYNEYYNGKTSPDNWRDVDKILERDEYRNKITSLKDFVTSNLPPEDEIPPQWLKNTVNLYYNPPKKEVIPSGLMSYWEYYLNLREYELKQSKGTWLKWVQVKSKVTDFEDNKGQTYKVSDVNENFKNDWVKYLISEDYAQSYIKKCFSYIKMICRHAKSKGIEVNPGLDNLKVKFKKENFPKIYLSFNELNKIAETPIKTDYLDNARDWLLISCYTGQRVSDFMRFTPKMIRETNGKRFLDVRQQKTEKEVSIPLLPEVETVLNKHGGNFPRAISQQKYNDYIKEVGKLAGINEPTKGKVLKKVSKDKYRKVAGTYPKFELLTSHVGRRSLATNYYGIIPSSFLKNITGHSTEAMLLKYIGKTSKDTANEAYDLMLNAKK